MLPMVVMGGFIKASAVEISGDFAKGDLRTIDMWKTSACGGWVIV